MERDRETDRQTDRDRDRQRQRHRERQRQRDRERQRETERDRVNRGQKEGRQLSIKIGAYQDTCEVIGTRNLIINPISLRLLTEQRNDRRYWHRQTEQILVSTRFHTEGMRPAKPIHFVHAYILYCAVNTISTYRTIVIRRTGKCARGDSSGTQGRFQGVNGIIMGRFLWSPPVYIYGDL